MSSNGYLLEVKGLRAVFFLGRGRIVQAEDGVDLAIEPGVTMGPVGESGSGKTVLALSELGRLLNFGTREDLCWQCFLRSPVSEAQNLQILA